MSIQQLTSRASLVALTTLLSLLCLAASALAAAPETPATQPATTVTGSEATLNGEVNPGAATEPVLYHFAYTPGTGAECTTSGQTAPLGPPFPEIAGTKAKVSEPLTGLEPDREYSFCLIAANPAAETETAQGNTGSFKTLPVAPIVENQSTLSVTPFAAFLQAEVNPENEPTAKCWVEYGKTLAYGTEAKCTLEEPLTGASPQPVFAHVPALEPATTYDYRFVVKNEAGETTKGPPGEFTTLPPPPSATTGGASGITRTAATLSGTVNPEGTEPSSNTTWCFEYAREGEPKYHLGIAGIPGEAVPGTANVEVTAALTGLEPNQTYHYRLVAVNDVNSPTGTSNACNTGNAYETDGEDKLFTTVALAPIVSTDEAAAVSATTATLDGSIVPRGVDARYHFEYGPTTSYGASVPLPDGDAGTGTTGESVTESIGGLTPNTTYHYRLVATTSGGTTYGWDQAFFTTTEIPIVQTAPSFGVGTAPVGAQIATFPDLTALAPVSPANVTTEAPKPLTRAQKLAKALKQCKKDVRHAKRKKCEKEARARYGPVRKKVVRKK